MAGDYLATPPTRTGAEVMSLKSELIEAMAEAVTLHTSHKQVALLGASVMLSAHSAFLSVRGLKVVGREATIGMVVDGLNAQEGEHIDGTPTGLADIWQVMLDAAPDLFAEAPDAG